MPKPTADKELVAMATILESLSDLDGESIQRVFDYVFSRLSISAPSPIQSASASTNQPVQSVDSSARIRRVSIRDLKDEKRPESSNQMAALVAYYLSEVADPIESKQSINTADLEKYFKQAGFRLPRSLPQTLPNATAAGYFDAEGSGLYRLNPVGYNLVVHGLLEAMAAAINLGSVLNKRQRNGLASLSALTMNHGRRTFRHRRNRKPVDGADGCGDC